MEDEILADFNEFIASLSSKTSDDDIERLVRWVIQLCANAADKQRREFLEVNCKDEATGAFYAYTSILAMKRVLLPRR